MRADYDAVVFDLLTALLDSWTLWNSVAGSEAGGLRWRRRYLELTYGAGLYVPYEALVARAATEAGLGAEYAVRLAGRWDELSPWPEATRVLRELGVRARLGIVTNCSIALGERAAGLVGVGFDAVTTAEGVGYYKPRPEPYRAILAALGTSPARTLFVAGSASDVPGASAVGMAVMWHNRIGLPASGAARPILIADRLDPLLDLVG